MADAINDKDKVIKRIKAFYTADVFEQEEEDPRFDKLMNYINRIHKSTSNHYETLGELETKLNTLTNRRMMRELNSRKYFAELYNFKRQERQAKE